MTIAIIGAGMAGLACATRLADEGRETKLFDKGRGPGGRMATRRAEVDGRTLHFDHGAQYFTIRDDRFREQVRKWEEAGVVAPWPAAKEGAWVGTPGMNAPIRAMADRLDVDFGVRVEAMGRSGEGWRLDGDGVPDTVYEAVIIAVPAEQVAPLAQPHAHALQEMALSSTSEPCWTLMAAFDDKVDHGDTLHRQGPIGWAARNSAKPGRDAQPECWVVQASPEWSRSHLDLEKGEAAKRLLAEFAEQVGELPDPIHLSAHRWLYAMCESCDEGFYWDFGTRVGACGDWLKGPRVEDAYLSGLELAEAVIASG